MRSGRLIVVGLTVLTLSIAGSLATPAHAFDDKAHQALASATVGTGQVNFDEVLRRQLGFMAGVNEKFDGKTAREWIMEGAKLEDAPVTRVLNHFHDPTQPFDLAGLRIVFQFESAAVWAQDRAQGRFPFFGGNHSWFAARDAFYRALTAPDDAKRRTAVKETFVSLGQLIHLVHDQASPAHTRNDSHLPLIDTDGFHTWGEKEDGGQSVIRDTPPVFPDPSLIPGPTVPGNSLAPLPIARLIDTGRFRQMNVPEAGTDIGLAEFSSANFLSEGILTHTFFTRPFPSPASFDVQELTYSKTQEKRLYFVKAREGAVGYRLAGVSAFGNIPVVTLDDDVYTDYGRVLFPRAKGLGAALLNYFFRGRIEFAPPDRFVYALAPFTVDNSASFPKLRFKVRNASGNEKAGPGTIVAIAQYRTSTGNLFETPEAPLSDTRFTSISAPQLITLDDTFQELTFDFSVQPIPTNAADLVLSVVYRGPLGSEPDAVIFGGQDIPEPDPIYIIDASDYDCFAGDPVFVTGLPPTSRDVNGDGVQDLFGPFFEQGVLVKVGPFGLRQSPSGQNFDFSIQAMTGAQYGRFVVLHDQTVYFVGILTNVLQEASTGRITTGFLRFFPLTGIVNTLSVDFDGSTRRQISFTPLQYRGISFLHGVATVPPNGSSCFTKTFTRPPPVVEVPGTLPPPD